MKSLLILNNTSGFIYDVKTCCLCNLHDLTFMFSSPLSRVLITGALEWQLLSGSKHIAAVCWPVSKSTKTLCKRYLLLRSVKKKKSSHFSKASGRARPLTDSRKESSSDWRVQVKYSPQRWCHSWMMNWKIMNAMQAEHWLAGVHLWNA